MATCIITKHMRCDGWGFGHQWLIPGWKHLGQDMERNQINKKVSAYSDGVVRYVKNTPEWGSGVCIEHTAPDKHKYTSIYWHIKDVQLKIEQNVKCGQIIGVISELTPTARWNIPHLHFGLRTGGYIYPDSIKGGIIEKKFPDGFVNPYTWFRKNKLVR